MPVLTGSPWMLAVSAIITMTAVFTGAMLALWVRRASAARMADVTTTLRLFEEFHSPEFIKYRRRAYERLQRPDADGFVRTLPLCVEANDDTRRDALLALAYFMEKLCVLWIQKKVDRRLVCGLLGRYTEFYGRALFAADGQDAADEEWGDWVVTLKTVFAEIQKRLGKNERVGPAAAVHG